MTININALHIITHKKTFTSLQIKTFAIQTLSKGVVIKTSISKLLSMKQENPGMIYECLTDTS
jgi:hypothetical protein